MTKPKRKSKEAALEATKPPITIIEACQDPDVFGPWFKDRLTWISWFVFLRVMFGLALQLPFPQVSESMGNHDSKIVDAASVD